MVLAPQAAVETAQGERRPVALVAERGQELLGRASRRDLVHDPAHVLVERRAAARRPPRAAAAHARAGAHVVAAHVQQARLAALQRHEGVGGGRTVHAQVRLGAVGALPVQHPVHARGRPAQGAAEEEPRAIRRQRAGVDAGAGRRETEVVVGRLRTAEQRIGAGRRDELRVVAAARRRDHRADDDVGRVVPDQVEGLVEPAAADQRDARGEAVGHQRVLDRAAAARALLVHLVVRVLEEGRVAHRGRRGGVGQEQAVAPVGVHEVVLERHVAGLVEADAVALAHAAAVLRDAVALEVHALRPLDVDAAVVRVQLVVHQVHVGAAVDEEPAARRQAGSRLDEREAAHDDVRDAVQVQAEGGLRRVDHDRPGVARVQPGRVAAQLDRRVGAAARAQHQAARVRAGADEERLARLDLRQRVDERGPGVERARAAVRVRAAGAHVARVGRVADEGHVGGVVERDRADRRADGLRPRDQRADGAGRHAVRVRARRGLDDAAADAGHRQRHALVRERLRLVVEERDGHRHARPVRLRAEGRLRDDRRDLRVHARSASSPSASAARGDEREAQDGEDCAFCSGNHGDQGGTRFRREAKDSSPLSTDRGAREAANRTISGAEGLSAAQPSARPVHTTGRSERRGSSGHCSSCRRSARSACSVSSTSCNACASSCP